MRSPKEEGNFINLTTLKDSSVILAPKKTANLKKLRLNCNPNLVLTFNQKEWIINLEKADLILT